MQDDTAERNSKHLVILLHGINTFAEWTSEVRKPLEREGFSVASSSYGFFSVFRFLLPIERFRQQAVIRFLDEVRTAIVANKSEKVSVICHSFGTYVTAHAILRSVDIKWYRIIFCGSVVKSEFPFDRLLGHFKHPILNEVGSKDIWPALAQSVTWGYGYAGSHGLNHPLIRTRWHEGLSHSDFLTEDFCKRFWLPFLLDVHPVDGDRPRPRRFQRVITRLKIRWLLALCLLLMTYLFMAFIFPCSWVNFASIFHGACGDKHRAMACNRAIFSTGGATGYDLNDVAMIDSITSTAVRGGQLVLGLKVRENVDLENLSCLSLLFCRVETEHFCATAWQDYRKISGYSNSFVIPMEHRYQPGQYNLHVNFWFVPNKDQLTDDSSIPSFSDAKLYSEKREILLK